MHGELVVLLGLDRARLGEVLDTLMKERRPVQREENNNNDNNNNNKTR